MTFFTPFRLAAAIVLLAAAFAFNAEANVKRICCRMPDGPKITEQEECREGDQIDDRACWPGGFTDEKICCYKSGNPFLVEEDVCKRNRGIVAIPSACWPSTKKQGDICCALPDRYRFMDIAACQDNKGRKTVDRRCR